MLSVLRFVGDCPLLRCNATHIGTFMCPKICFHLMLRHSSNTGLGPASHAQQPSLPRDLADMLWQRPEAAR